VEDPMGAQWVDDAAFDLRRHVVRERLGRRRGQTPTQALEARVGQLAAQPLDRARPLWQMHVVEDFDGGSALIARIHHCIADGIALITVMLSITDGGAPPPPRRSRGEASDWLADAVIRPLAGLTAKALDASGDGLAKSLEMLREPQQALQVARTGYQVL